MNFNQNIKNPLQRDPRCLDLAHKIEGQAYLCCLGFFFFKIHQLPFFQKINK